jgi:hypothetical protein
LLPARPADPTPPAVVRAAPPAAPAGYQFQPPASVPAPGVSRTGTQPQPKPSLFGGMADGVKAAFGGKPAEPAQWWPTGEQGQPGQPPPPAAPAAGARPVPMPAAPPPGVYAGPPAYRWYGYGTPAPGSNPYAPTGRYPQGSASWFTQTGATPGAFPIPVGGGALNPYEPPVLVQALPPDPPRPVTFRDTPRPTLTDSPRLADRAEPTMPAGNGTPIAYDPTPPEVSWLPATANSRVPIAATTPAAPGVKAGDPLPLPVGPPADPGPDWGPAKRAVPGDAPLPAVTLIRGQAPVASTNDLDGLIRSACFGRANRVLIERPGPQRLHLKLVVPTEADARDAAAVVSRLPELKAYSVTFEATVGK